MDRYIKPEFYVTEFDENDISSHLYVNGIMRSIQGETILVSTEKQRKHRKRMITFSKTGEILWSMLSKKQTEEQLVYFLAAVCGKKEQEVQEDVDEFIEKAIKEDLIVYCDEKS